MIGMFSAEENSEEVVIVVVQGLGLGDDCLSDSRSLDMVDGTALSYSMLVVEGDRGFPYLQLLEGSA
jgi:hypothetical protein